MVKKFENFENDQEPTLTQFIKSLLLIELFDSIFENRKKEFSLGMITWACQKVREMDKEKLKELYESLRTNKGRGYDNNTLEDAILLKAINLFGDL
jgi:hypothetical protein